MKNFLILLLVALITIAILLFVFNPQMLSDIWLWIVGLIGPIVALIKNGFDSLVNLVQKKKNVSTEKRPSPQNDLASENKKLQESTELDQNKIEELELEISNLQDQIKNQNDEDVFEGKTLSVLRYFDDGETTLGLLFFENQFVCYTLEDTHRDVKVMGETRIPSGTYNIDFIKILTPLTRKYRKRYSWFNYHIEIKNVKNFTGIYIHSGSNHIHTKGCLLIADGIYSSDERRTIFNSRKTYEKFYKQFSELREAEIKVRIKIFDELWFKTGKIKNRYT